MAPSRKRDRPSTTFTPKKRRKTTSEAQSTGEANDSEPNYISANAWESHQTKPNNSEQSEGELSSGALSGGWHRVKQILSESKYNYYVAWEGCNPKTRKPWKNSWIPKTNVTAGTEAEWKSRKEAYPELNRLVICPAEQSHRRRSRKSTTARKIKRPKSRSPAITSAEPSPLFLQSPSPTNISSPKLAVFGPLFYPASPRPHQGLSVAEVQVTQATDFERGDYTQTGSLVTTNLSRSVVGPLSLTLGQTIPDSQSAGLSSGHNPSTQASSSIQAIKVPLVIGNNISHLDSIGCSSASLEQRHSIPSSGFGQTLNNRAPASSQTSCALGSPPPTSILEVLEEETLIDKEDCSFFGENVLPSDSGKGGQKITHPEVPETPQATESQIREGDALKNTFLEAGQVLASISSQKGSQESLTKGHFQGRIASLLQEINVGNQAQQESRLSDPAIETQAPTIEPSRPASGRDIEQASVGTKQGINTLQPASKQACHSHNQNHRKVLAEPPVLEKNIHREVELEEPNVQGKEAIDAPRTGIERNQAPLEQEAVGIPAGSQTSVRTDDCVVPEDNRGDLSASAVGGSNVAQLLTKRKRSLHRQEEHSALEEIGLLCESHRQERAAEIVQETTFQPLPILPANVPRAESAPNEVQIGINQRPGRPETFVDQNCHNSAQLSSTTQHTNNISTYTLIPVQSEEPVPSIEIGGQQGSSPQLLSFQSSLDLDQPVSSCALVRDLGIGNIELSNRDASLYTTNTDQSPIAATRIQTSIDISSLPKRYELGKIQIPTPAVPGHLITAGAPNFPQSGNRQEEQLDSFTAPSSYSQLVANQSVTVWRSHTAPISTNEREMTEDNLSRDPSQRGSQETDMESQVPLPTKESTSNELLLRDGMTTFEKINALREHRAKMRKEMGECPTTGSNENEPLFGPSSSDTSPDGVPSQQEPSDQVPSPQVHTDHVQPEQMSQPLPAPIPVHLPYTDSTQRPPTLLEQASAVRQELTQEPETRSPSVIPAQVTPPAPPAFGGSRRLESVNNSRRHQERPFHPLAISSALSYHRDQDMMDEDSILLDDPPLTQGEYIVPLTLLPQQMAPYRQAMKHQEHLITRFTSARSAEDIGEAQLLIERLHDIAYHVDLLDNGTATQPPTDSQQAYWDGTQASSKFRFLDQFLDLIRDRDWHVVLAVRSGRQLEIAETFLRGKHLNYLRADNGQRPSESTSGSLSITLLPTSGDGANTVLRTAQLIISLDHTFRLLLESQDRGIQTLRTHLLHPDALAPILYLTPVYTPEHIERCFSPMLKGPERLRLLVSFTAQLRGSAGKPPYSRLDALAPRIVEFLDAELADTPFPIPAIGGIKHLIEIDEPPSQFESGTSEAPALVSTQEPAAHQGTPKRPFTFEGEDEASNKRMRMTPQPETVNPNDVSITRISDSVNAQSSQPKPRPNIEDLSTEWQTLYRKSQSHNRELTNDLAGLQTRFESRTIEYRTTCKERDEALASLEKVRDELAQEKNRSRGYQDKVATLTKEVALLNSKETEEPAIPEVAELIRLQQEKKTADEARVKAETRYGRLEQDFEFTRARYQDASNAAADLAQENESLKTENEHMRKKLSGELTKLKEMSQQNTYMTQQQEIQMLRARLKTTEDLLRRKEEEIKGYKSRERMPTRGNSVPRSPRVGANGGSRAASPMPGISGIGRIGALRQS